MGAVDTPRVYPRVFTLGKNGLVPAPTEADQIANKILSADGNWVDPPEGLDAIIRDGSTEFTGNQSMGGFRLTNLGAPTQADDAVTRAYVEAISNNLDIKQAVRLATTGNITLSGNQSIDGVTTNTNDRILVKNQTSAEDNGIYLAAVGAWTRTTDADEDSEVNNGLSVFVTSGTVNGSTNWVLITPDPVLVGITSLTFTQVGAPVDYTPGDGIDITGTVISVDITNFIGTGLVSDGSNNINVDQTADDIPTIVSGFDGILSASEDDVQKALDVLDDHTHAHSELTGIGIDDHHARDHAATHSDGGADQITVENLATGSTNVAQRLAPDGSGGLAFATLAHSELTGIGTDDHHARDHAATHSVGGADPINVENLATSLTDTNLRLMPNGSGGVQFAVDPGEIRNTVSTSDATETTLANIAIPDNTVMLIEARVVGRRTNSSSRAGYFRRALVYRQAGGAATIEGQVQTNFTQEFNPQWNATIDVSGNSARIRVTGIAGATINWKSSHRQLDVS